MEQSSAILSVHGSNLIIAAVKTSTFSPKVVLLLTIKQVLLKRIERDGKKYEAWRVICSSENSRLSPQNLWQLPSKLLDSCSAFIEGKKPTYYLEDEIDAKSKNSDL